MGKLPTIEEKRMEIASVYGREWVAEKSDRQIQAIWWRMSRNGCFGPQRQRDCGINPDPINEPDPKIGNYQQMSLFDYVGGEQNGK